MSPDARLTFVVPVSDEKVYERNLRASPVFHETHPHEIIEQRGFRSASLAYNAAIERAENDIIVFAHQDVIFPRSWLDDLERALRYLGDHDPRWGVLGCYGIAKGQRRGFLYDSSQRIIRGEPFGTPVQAQTLDEIVLIIRRSSGLRFDASLPHFHLYGADICMAAAVKGLKCYVISAFCLHNTNQIPFLPKEFYECYFHIRRKYRHLLPIHTSCIKISRLNFEVYERALRKIFSRILGKNSETNLRFRDPLTLLEIYCKDGAIRSGKG